MPKKTHKKTSKLPVSTPFLVVLIIALLVSGLTVFEKWRHSTLHKSVTSVAAALADSGYSHDKIATQCRHVFQHKYSTDQHHDCKMSFRAEKTNIDRGNLSAEASTLIRLIESTSDFKMADDMSSRSDLNESEIENLSTLYMLKHKQSGKQCSISYALSQEETSILLSMVCDDNSWFGKTFRS